MLRGLKLGYQHCIPNELVLMVVVWSDQVGEGEQLDLQIKNTNRETKCVKNGTNADAILRMPDFWAIQKFQRHIHVRVSVSVLFFLCFALMCVLFCLEFLTGIKQDLLDLITMLLKFNWKHYKMQRTFQSSLWWFIVTADTTSLDQHKLYCWNIALCKDIVVFNGNVQEW